MQMTEIRKESIGVVESMNSAITALAASASEILGYTVLAKVAQAVIPIELTPLQAALKSIDVEVMNVSDVHKYMKERLVEQVTVSLGNWLKEIAPKESLKSYERFNGPMWERTPIREYRQPVPEFVLAKAVQIKQALPECEIWIESLNDHPDPFLVVGIKDVQPYRDPLELYYVEVWDEPKFERRLNSDDIPF